jgi:putative hydrolase of the HAD superfamily
MAEIRNIIFDLGGVLMDLYVERTYKAFQSMGFTQDILQHDRNHKNIFFQFEIGAVTPEQFRDEIRELIGNRYDDDHIDRAWNAMIGGFRKEKIEFVKKLRPQYRTYILSNTNQMHEAFYNRLIRLEYGLKSLNDIFDRVYYSHHIHLAKPDPAIFKYVLDENGLTPEETLYLDDTMKHLEAASALGIKTVLFPLNGNLEMIYEYLD